MSSPSPTSIRVLAAVMLLLLPLVHAGYVKELKDLPLLPHHTLHPRKPQDDNSGGDNGSGNSGNNPKIQCDKKTAVCSLPGVSEKCLAMWMPDGGSPCQAFTDYYLPLNFKDFIGARFPEYINDGWVLPQNSSGFAYLFQNYTQSYFGNYQKSYSVDMFACTSPHQMWYNWWMCTDLLMYYRQEKQHPCATFNQQNPPICQSTLSDRAQSITADLHNITVCDITQKNQQRGLNFTSQLPNHPWASTDGSCISGQANSPDLSCGRDPLLACDVGCADVPDQICNALRATAAKQLAAMPDSDADAADPNRKGQNRLVSYGSGVFGGVVIIMALVVLANVRRKSKKAGAKASAHASAAAPASAADGLPAGTMFIPLKDKSKPTPTRTPTTGSQDYRQTPAVTPLQQPQGYYPPQQQQQPVQAMMPTPPLNAAVGGSPYGMRPQQPYPVSSSPHSMQGLAPVQHPSPMFAPSPATIPAPAGAATPSMKAASAAIAAQRTPSQSARAVRTVVVPYTAEQPDEISMRAGDQATVSQDFGDGWGSGSNLTTGQKGVFPLTCFSTEPFTASRHH
ncbi:hypothetical protein RI367_002937 [Sorochytrium milnesiophthora]